MPEKIIKSKLFAGFPNLVHGMSTKFGAVNEPPFFNNLSSRVGDKAENVTANKKEFYSSLGIEESLLAIPHQVHSDNIQIVDKPGFYADTDGLITSRKDLFLVISTADCVPVMIYDRRNSVIAAIHSGWRGTQKNITGKVIEMLIRNFKSEPEDLVIFIGPGISSEHFEVGKDVSEMFEQKYVIQRGEKYYVNILENILDQIKNFEVKQEQIEFSEKCTFAEKDYLHSYRRDRDKSGRMFSVIGIRD